MSGGRVPAPAEEDERPPLLGSWRNLYLLVAVVWLGTIVLCGWIAAHNR